MATGSYIQKGNVAVAFLFVCALCLAQDSLDPLSLVRGAVSARQHIPPSSLELAYRFRSRDDTNTLYVHVDFDGPKRAFCCFASPDKKNSHWKTVFDGTKAIVYEERLKQVSLRPLSTPQSGLLLFDPRILGLVHAYSWAETLENALPYHATNTMVQMVGRENVDAHPAYHIRVPGPLPIDYWIDTNQFRVYRKQWGGIETLSYYANSNFPWLPSRVVSKVYAHWPPLQNEKPQYEQETEILFAKTNILFPKERWTLEAIQPKRGTEVVDYRLKTSLGTWDGRHLIKSADSNWWSLE